MFPIIIGVVIIAVSGIFYTRITTNVDKKNEIVINSPSPSPSAASSPSSTPSPTPEESDTSRNSVHITITTPKPAPTSNTTQDIDLQYPGSNKTGSNTYQSSDDPGKITDWYKDKIKSLGANSKSFVQTNTNGNVLNKLVGAKSGLTISVEIKKRSGDNQTTITVTLDT